MDFILAIAALFIGGTLSFVLITKNHQKKISDLQSIIDFEKSERSTINEQKSRLEEKVSHLESNLNKTQSDLKEQLSYVQHYSSSFAGQKERNEELEKRLTNLKDDFKLLQQQNTELQNRLFELNSALSTQKERNDGLQLKLDEQQQLFEERKEQLKNELQVLSNSILEEKSKKFTEQNSIQLKQILEPLGLRIDEFKKKVEDTYSVENQERATLKEQIRQMSELNQRMSQEAQNLTKALKGDSKTQGNWGEVILERILEKSGLRKGYEFDVQITERNEDNRMIRPDVVVNLPDEKFMIIDSKVSLTAFEQFVNAESEEERSKQLKMHLLSLKSHIKGLSEKNYHQLYGNQSPDFVLLFIPIQPAFDVAMMNEPDLYNSAFEQNIILVSPTTLLATLSTVSSVWKQEYQNKNAMEIAEQSGRMYDKFVGLVDDLEKVGKAIQSTSKVYDDAMNKLSTGKGNLINRAESLRKLGIKANKQLPSQYIDDELENE